MRKAVAIVLALLLAGAIHGSTVVLIKKPASGHPADVLLWTNWEVGACTTCIYTQHATNEYAVSDNVWGSNTADIGSSGAYLGSWGLTSGPGQALNNEINATDECLGVDNPWDCCTGGTGTTGGGTGTGCENVSGSEGNIGFWFQIKTNWTDDFRFMRVKTDNTNEFYCATVSGGDINCGWEVTGVQCDFVDPVSTTSTTCTTRTVTTTAEGFVIDHWYHIQFRYDTATPEIRLIITDNTGTVLSNTTADLTTGTDIPLNDFVAPTYNTTTGFLVGAVELSSTASAWIDQIIVSNDSSRDIYGTWAAQLNYP